MKRIRDTFKKIFNSRKRMVGLVIVLLLIGLAAWKILSGKQASPQYQTAQVERGTLVSSVSASGQVLTVNIMSVSTKASGIVSQVYVKDGDQVKKGDKLLKVDLDLQGEQKYSQAWASYLSAKNSLDSAQTSLYSLQSDMFGKWDTFKNLAEGDQYENSDGTPRYDQRASAEFHIADDNWLAAEAKYKNQVAVISQAQASLNSSWLNYQLASPIISAPVSGVITSLMFTEGMSIGTLDTGTNQSNEKIVTIQTQGMPIVSVDLSEIDVTKVKIGQKVNVTLDSIPDKSFTGKVVTVDHIGTTSNNVTSYTANIRLDTQSDEILPNMQASAAIVIEVKNDVLLVPSSAVQTQQSGSFVQVLKNGKVESTSVEPGISSDTQTEVLSGLSEGDQVITGTVSSSTRQQSSSIFGGGAFRTGGFSTQRRPD